MGIRFDNLSPLQKYLCSFDTKRAPKIISAKFTPQLKCDTFTKSTPINALNINMPFDYDKMHNFCNYLHRQGEKSFETYKNLFEKTFADILQNGGELKGRVKSTDSIFNKFIQRRAETLSEMEQVYGKIPDIRGYKLVTNGMAEDMQKVVEKIKKLIENNELVPVSVLNRGKNPYLNDNQTEYLAKMGFRVKNADTPGLNNINALFKDKTGKTLELQITGKETEKLSEKEHPFYKYRQQEIQAMATDDNGNCIDDLTVKYGLLKELGLLNKYSDYVNDCYTYARNLELGIPAKKPILPEKVQEIFNYAETYLKTK